MCEWQGAEHIAKRQSSGWGERAWCADCGSPVWFRVTVDSPYAGTIELPIGSFDDANGLTMANEIYIDHEARQLCLRGRGAERFDPGGLRGTLSAAGQ